MEAHANLEQARRAQRARATEARARVDVLVQRHDTVSRSLESELGTLQDQGRALETLEAEARDTSFLTVLRRRLRGRTTALERRSATEGLLRRYEAVDTRVREAAAFCDELELEARRLQRDVAALHDELQQAESSRRQAATRLLELELELERARADDSLHQNARDQQVDALEFEVRTAAVHLDLHEAMATLTRQHLGPTRDLRDLVQRLHGELARFVLAATATTSQAGRRIQALGLAADAPAVVVELQESLQDLQQASEDTVQYIATSRQLVERVLPDLTRRIEASSLAPAVRRIEDVDMARARARAEEALRLVAAAEVDTFLES